MKSSFVTVLSEAVLLTIVTMLTVEVSFADSLKLCLLYYNILILFQNYYAQKAVPVPAPSAKLTTFQPPVELATLQLVFGGATNLRDIFMQ